MDLDDQSSWKWNDLGQSLLCFRSAFWKLFNFLIRISDHMRCTIAILCDAICSGWSTLDISSAYIVDICFSLLQTLQRFAIVGLSNFYFDVAKDRLYVGYGIHPMFISICI